MTIDPTDKELETAGERYAENRHGAYSMARILVSHAELLALLVTYSDGEAHDLLDELRGRFWGSDAVQAETNKIIEALRENKAFEETRDDT